MKILLVNGPNLNLLGLREPERYGAVTLEEIEASVGKLGQELGVEVESFQSNSEGDLVSCIGSAAGLYDGILINPAAYTHTSIALRDALLAVGLPSVEIHLTNTQSRETFRHTSFTAPACIGVVTGFGSFGYLLALRGLMEYINSRSAS